MNAIDATASPYPRGIRALLCSVLQAIAWLMRPAGWWGGDGFREMPALYQKLRVSSDAVRLDERKPLAISIRGRLHRAACREEFYADRRQIKIKAFLGRSRKERGVFVVALIYTPALYLYTVSESSGVFTYIISDSLVNMVLSLIYRS